MSASVQDVAYSSDFVENGNARAVRIVPQRDKEIPKSWRCVKPDCRHGAIVASSRQCRDGLKVPEPAKYPLFISEDEKMSGRERFRWFAAGEILL
jgi:hypothetical protein